MAIVFLKYDRPGSKAPVDIKYSYPDTNIDERRIAQAVAATDMQRNEWRDDTRRPPDYLVDASGVPTHIFDRERSTCNPVVLNDKGVYVDSTQIESNKSVSRNRELPTIDWGDNGMSSLGLGF
ncbi:hypothetical protein J6A31_01000 [bacterium]|nr:hypothetical protein [bacterium]